jgi:hypothetical protein
MINRLILVRLLESIPFFLPVARMAKRHLAYLAFRVWKAFILARAMVCPIRLDVNNRYWVSTSTINLVCLRASSNLKIYCDKGRIKGGSWDRHTARFEDLDVFQAIKDRFINGKPWNETQFYHRVLKQIGEGDFRWTCRTKEDLEKRCKGLEKLFKDIKHKPHESQDDIMRHKANCLVHDEDEFNVCIDRDGQLLLGNETHRLAIAKICGVDRVPVNVVVRHSKWYRFRMEIMSYPKLPLVGEKIYHPLTHPDLQDIPPLHDKTRFEIIKSHVPVPKGDLLDIGANSGYFCHRFEELGFSCYAVEANPINLYFLRKLRNAQNRKFHVIAKSIFEYHEKTHFDLVLALNIFHHFLKKKQSHEQLIDFLETLSTNFMFFQPHLPSEPQMIGAYRNYECDEFANFVSKHSSLTHCALLGKDTDGRPIYKLYK